MARPNLGNHQPAPPLHMEPGAMGLDRGDEWPDPDLEELSLASSLPEAMAEAPSPPKRPKTVGTQAPASRGSSGITPRQSSTFGRSTQENQRKGVPYSRQPKPQPTYIPPEWARTKTTSAVKAVRPPESEPSGESSEPPCEYPESTPTEIVPRVDVASIEVPDLANLPKLDFGEEPEEGPSSSLPFEVGGGQFGASETPAKQEDAALPPFPPPMETSSAGSDTESGMPFVSEDGLGASGAFTPDGASLEEEAFADLPAPPGLALEAGKNTDPNADASSLDQAALPDGEDGFDLKGLELGTFAQESDAKEISFSTQEDDASGPAFPGQEDDANALDFFVPGDEPNAFGSGAGVDVTSASPFPAQDQTSAVPRENSVADTFGIPAPPSEGSTDVPEFDPSLLGAPSEEAGPEEANPMGQAPDPLTNESALDSSFGAPDIPVPEFGGIEEAADESSPASFNPPAESFDSAPESFEGMSLEASPQPGDAGLPGDALGWQEPSTPPSEDGASAAAGAAENADPPDSETEDELFEGGLAVDLPQGLPDQMSPLEPPSAEPDNCQPEGENDELPAPPPEDAAEAEPPALSLSGSESIAELANMNEAIAPSPFPGEGHPQAPEEAASGEGPPARPRKKNKRVSSTGLEKMAQQAIKLNKEAMKARNKQRSKKKKPEAPEPAYRKYGKYIFGAIGLTLAATVGLLLLEQDILRGMLGGGDEDTHTYAASIVAPAENGGSRAQAAVAAEDFAGNPEGKADSEAADMGDRGGVRRSRSGKKKGSDGAAAEIASRSDSVDEESSEKVALAKAIAEERLRLQLENDIEEAKYAVANSDYEPAISRFLSAEQTAKQLGDNITLRWIRQELGKAYRIRGELIMRDVIVGPGDCQKALNYFKRSIALGYNGKRNSDNIKSAQHCTNRRLTQRRSRRR